MSNPASHEQLDDVAEPALSLIVVHCSDIEAARKFYGLLGLSFVEEQHGKGPRHYAATLGTVVLELYPCQGTNSPPLHLGFRIPNLDRTLAALRSNGAAIVSEGKDSPWGRQAVVKDPFGNRVELYAQESRP